MGDPTNNAGDPVNSGLSRRRRAEDEPLGFTERPVLKQSVDTEALKRAINAHVPTKLSAAHPHDITGLSDVTAERLLKAVINGERGYLNLIVDQLLDNRIGMVMLYEQLLRPVSTELGELWREDKLDFVDVELATARLQMMCNRFAARFAATQNNIDPAKRIILARVRGERHMLGLSIVEVFFSPRRMGR